MRKMRSTGQTPGSIRQVLLILSLLAAGSLVSCLQEEVPPPPYRLYGGSGDQLVLLSGLEDLPPPVWTPVESASIPVGFLNQGGTGLVLLNHQGLGELVQEGDQVRLNRLGPADPFLERQLLGLWTWNEKMVLATRSLTPLEESPALWVWYPDSRSYQPLPLPSQVKNPGYRLVEVCFSDLTWDFLWSHSQGFAASRFYPASGIDEPWDHQNFIETHEPLTWELLPEPFQSLSRELGPAAALLELTGAQPQAFRKVGTPPTLMVWGGTGPNGSFLINEAGRLVLGTPEGGIKEVLELPQLPNLRYTGGLALPGGVAVFWQLERGSLRSHWGIIWIPQDQRI